MDEGIQTETSRTMESHPTQDEGTMTLPGPDLLAQGHVRKRLVSEHKCKHFFIV